MVRMVWVVVICLDVDAFVDCREISFSVVTEGSMSWGGVAVELVEVLPVGSGLGTVGESLSVVGTGKATSASLGDGTVSGESVLFAGEWVSVVVGEPAG